MKRYVALIATLALAVLLWWAQTPGVAQQNPAPAGRRLEILFLGDKGHHQPEARYKIIKRHLGRRGINFTYTEAMTDLNLTTLRKYDGLMIYANTTEISTAQEEALLEYVRTGGGFLPIHCASFCFLNSPKYIELVGAQFKSHGTGVFNTDIVAPDHPVMKDFAGFETWDETYVHHLHNENRVVLQKREEEPWTWVRKHGDGRVFYTAYGHDERCWDQDAFHDLIYRGIRFAVGDERAALLDALALPTLVYKEAILPNYERRDPPPMAQEPLSPSESMKMAQVPVDMELSLFASEPDIVNPIAMAWDERGRMWVLETVDYPNNLQADDLGHDRLKILEDTDGDGRADKFTVFADKLSIPSTIVFSNDGVIITDGEDVLYLKDTDGDDRADIREVLFTGWSMGDTHAGPSNFRWGFDNWIWGTTGYSGFRGTIGGEPQRFATGVFHFKPDGSKMEFLQNTTNNTWGLGLTEEGDVVGSTANNNPSWYMTFPARYYNQVTGMQQGRTPRADVTRDLYMTTPDLRQVDAWGNFTAAAGHNVYTARNYPEKYWNKLALICGPTGHLLNACLMEREGTKVLTYNAGNLYASADAWSAPVAADVGPDGAVWFCDWYNVIIQHNPTPTVQRGGYDAETGKGGAYVTPLRDKQHGRIYRVGWKDAKAVAIPRLSKSDPQGLVATLSNDNLLWRMHAQRLLVERGKTDVVPALMKLVDDPSLDSLQLNVAAIHAINTLGGLGVTADLSKALHHPSPGVARAALRVMPKDEAFAKSVIEHGLLIHQDARVVRDACLALAEAPTSEAVGEALYAAFAKMAAKSEDDTLVEAFTVAAAKHPVSFLKAALAASPEGANEIIEEAQPNLLPNEGFEEVENGLPKGWKRYVYQGGRREDDPKYEVSSEGRNGGKCLQVTSERGSDSGLKVYVPLEKGIEYELSAWIKTQDIRNVRGGNGAMLNVEGNVSNARSDALKATQNWTKVSMRFRSEEAQRVGVNCLYGGYGQSVGTAWWDDVTLRAIGKAVDRETAVVQTVARHFRATGEAGVLAELVATVSASKRKLTANLLGALIGGANDVDDAAADLGRVIVLKTQPQKLLYDQAELKAKVGEKITIRFENNCDLPHNWVLCKPDSREAVGALADAFAVKPEALQRHYVPESTDILQSIRILGAGESGQATFTIPTAGKYPFICTFPGHWRVMTGTLVVE